MLLIIWGIIGSIFWGITVAILLWVLCAFAGKLVNRGYSMSMAQHVLCFVIAIPVVILLSVFFTCNKVNRMAERVDTSIANYLTADAKFTEQLQRQIKQASQTADAGNVTDYIADHFSKMIASEYPLLERYMDVNQILANSDLSKQLSGISQGINAAENTQQLIETTVGGITEGVKAKVKSVRRKMLIAVILLQAIPFGVVFYKASNYRSPAQSNFMYESGNYL